MQRLLAFLLSSLFLLNAFSQQLPAMQAPLASKSLMLDIIKINDKTLVAVGERGHILLSNDAITWRQANVPVRTTLTAVYFVDESHGWAVGHDATILFSGDGGENWVVQQFLPAKEKPLLDVTFKDNLQGIAIGAYGLLYRTIDGGKNWTFEFHGEFLLPDDLEYLEELKQEDEEAYLDEQSSILAHFNSIFKDGRTLYMVGEVGLIAKSSDFAKKWLPFDEIYQGSFNDISRTHQGNLLVVGLRGNVFRSLKNGTPWQHIKTGTQALLNSIVLGDNGSIYVLGNNGVILKSDDDGISFSLNPQADGKSLISGVWFKSQLIIVSEVGIKVIPQANIK
ncbi:MAG: photosystem II stability/assembly factor-like uncharacterized protein [Colwellia sp.]|jgi:photosystem II stability/assembly factor-like uncharacterized protein